MNAATDQPARLSSPVANMGDVLTAVLDIQAAVRAALMRQGPKQQTTRGVNGADCG